jgi:membrane protease YdiL (CAAX protease family)
MIERALPTGRRACATRTRNFDKENSVPLCRISALESHLGYNELVMRHLVGRGVVAGPGMPRLGRLYAHRILLAVPRTRRKVKPRLYGLEDRADAETGRTGQADAINLAAAGVAGANDSGPVSPSGASPSAMRDGERIGHVVEAGEAEKGPIEQGTCRSRDEAVPARTTPEQFKFSNLLVDMVRAFNATAPRAPWKLDTVFTVMLMWIVSFWIAAYSVVPSVLTWIKTTMLAPQGVTLSYSAEAALRHLLLDASQMVLIAVLLQRALRSYAYREFFAIRPKHKSAKKNVLSWVAIGFGVAAFPAVDWLHKTMVMLFSGGGQFVRSATNAGMFDGDGVYTKLVWFLVLGVAAPIWEEAMFRGFLLPSLARVTSPAMAVVVTSLLFSLVHFTREGFLPLMILGAIFGISYCVTRGLFTPIVLHGLWNVCLLAQVLWKGGL